MAAAKTARKSGPRRAERKIRAHGEESRERILDAATQIAGERGYDGTSVALVSERSGLPASSIYWHFESKDQLIAAVIERSFHRWLERMHAWVPPREGESQEELFEAAIRRTAAALTEAPDFLRLGLMLALERRPQEATARRMFLQVRERAYKGMVASYEAFFAGALDAADVRALATLTMAAADGLFIAQEVDPAGVDLDDAFQLLAEALLGAAKALSARRDRSRR
ncbi:MAG TPA: TetR/AcrR family transcriptional regulator [Deltaproteobacteria bacterium]|nr:TetR/AcrR family transcriptional regulator [Deltaproteobacteria bacterium]